MKREKSLVWTQLATEVGSMYEFLEQTGKTEGLVVVEVDGEVQTDGTEAGYNPRGVRHATWQHPSPTYPK